MALYQVAKTDNAAYTCIISCPGHNVEVVCDLPEQYALGVQSDWESRLPYSLSDILGNMIPGVGAGAAAFGSNGGQIQDLSFQMWMGTSPVEIPLTLNFDMEKTESGLEEVHKPIAVLQALAFPVNSNSSAGVAESTWSWMGAAVDKTGGSFLYPPGPRRGGSEGDYGVHVRIGKMLTMIDCIITSANSTFDTRLGPDGYPIAGQLEITFRTSVVYGHNDWLNAMNISGSAGTLIQKRQETLTSERNAGGGNR